MKDGKECLRLICANSPKGEYKETFHMHHARAMKENIVAKTEIAQANRG